MTHDEDCEADFGSQGQETPCRCKERAGLKTCTACGGDIHPCDAGDHWHHVTVPVEPHFPSVHPDPMTEFDLSSGGK